MRAVHETKAQRMFEWIPDASSVVAALVLIYLAIAPPILAGGIRSAPLSVLYSPIIYLIESDFNAPALWYFKACGYELLLIGDAPSFSWPVLLSYCAGIGLLGTVALLPIVRRFRKRRING